MTLTPQLRNGTLYPRLTTLDFITTSCSGSARRGAPHFSMKGHR